MNDLGLAIALGVGVLYTSASKLLGQATFSQRIAEMAVAYPFVAVLWGIAVALTLPRVGSWGWAAMGVLTAHWFVPAPPRHLSARYGVPLVLGVIGVSWWLPSWVALGLGALAAQVGFSRSEENWSITDSFQKS